MSTAQLSANRQNALLSTGPKLEQSKAISSQNALRYGFHTRAVVLPAEDRSEFDLFDTELRDHLRPQGPVENQIVDRIVASSWRLRRVVAIEQEIFIRLGSRFSKNEPPKYLGAARAMLQDGETGGHVFEKLTRYEAHLHRIFRRDLQDLLVLQSLRRPG